MNQMFNDTSPFEKPMKNKRIHSNSWIQILNACRHWNIVRQKKYSLSTLRLSLSSLPFHLISCSIFFWFYTTAFGTHVVSNEFHKFTRYCYANVLMLTHNLIVTANQRPQLVCHIQWMRWNWTKSKDNEKKEGFFFKTKQGENSLRCFFLFKQKQTTGWLK